VPEQLNAVVRNLSELGPRRLALAGGVIALVLAVIAVASIYLNRPAYETLYVGLERADVNQIGLVLGENGIGFDVAADGTTVLVTAGTTARARMLLAEKGLPTSTNAGYELFDNVGALGLTSFMQQVTRIRALEGEIARTIQSIVLPAPANHTLLYSPRCVRAVAGLLSDFLATNVTGRLSLGWQLQYLSREGKWDVKNLKKWQSVAPVSDPIGPAGKPIFRALKTLREADELHCPKELVANWGGTIRHVVDISKDQPVYDPRGLERAGIQYHKFPTVSKVPPSGDEVADFIALIDKIRAEEEAEGQNQDGEAHIGVHCHYGFNRTGYFIVCYLVERCGFSIQEAIDEFASKRPAGIRHQHFLNRLHVRYDIDAVRAE
jgi:protein-tyrosine phosphatase